MLTLKHKGIPAVDYFSPVNDGVEEGDKDMSYKEFQLVDIPDMIYRLMTLYLMALTLYKILPTMEWTYMSLYSNIY